MRALLRDRHRIPAGNLVEVRYEAFVQDAFRGTRAIYEALDLGGFEAVEEPLRAHLRSVEGYRRHAFRVDEALRARIRDELAFAFETLGYDPGDAAASNV